MTRVLLSFLFITCTALGQEQKVIFQRHSKMARIPTNTISYASDGKILLIRDLSFYQLYSFDTQVWTRLKFPQKLADEAAPASEFIPEENSIITIGSTIETLRLDNLMLSDPIKITQAYTMLSGSDVYKDKIYLIGGAIVKIRPQPVSEMSEGVFVFDPKNQGFERVFQLPVPLVTRSKFMNGFLYVFGGFDGEQAYDDILLFDPDHVNFGWKHIGTLPHTVSQYCLAKDDKRFYLMGTNDGVGYLGIYDPATFTYKEFPTNLNFAEGGLVIRDNKLYFFGGHLAEYPFTTNAYMYTLDLGTLEKK